MKLKFSRKFRPCQVDQDDELFPNGIFVFNVTGLLAFIHERPGDFPIEHVTVNSLGLTSGNLDEATVLNADLTRPILLAEIAPGGFNVIDGNHRICRARRDGVPHLPCYRVRSKQHIRFLTTAEGYRSYVDYWNGKLKDRAPLRR